MKGMIKMTDLEILTEMKNTLNLILLLQLFLFLKSIFGMITGFVNSFFD